MTDQNRSSVASTTGVGQNGSDVSVQNRRKAIAAMLDARRALAYGDVKTASAKSAEARSLYNGWTARSDSPDRLDRTIATYEKLRSERSIRGDSDAWKKLYAQSMIEQAEAFISWKEFAEAERLMSYATPYQSLFTEYDGNHPAKVLQKVAEAKKAAAGATLAAV
ncbi:MAG: hypothetical protein Q4C47_04600, partial [Planctomycetia bacterium]|nr:hypothetical protein [Planctomycetia bacterium]